MPRISPPIGGFVVGFGTHAPDAGSRCVLGGHSSIASGPQSTLGMVEHNSAGSGLRSLLRHHLRGSRLLACLALRNIDTPLEISAIFDHDASGLDVAD